MIDTTKVQERINQLLGERAALADKLKRLADETEQTRHLLSAYEGAIGELQRLAALAGGDDSE